jgi:hypothetical protein
MRIGRFTTKQRVLVGAATAVLAAGALIVVWAEEDDAETVAGPDTTLDHETTTTSTTVPTTTSTTAAGETTTARPTTAAPRGRVPGPVPDVSANPSAGSGEIAVRWGPATGATGYRVLRSATAGGRFVVAADINVTTGATTEADGVTTIWSANHNYRPGGPRLTTPDTSPWFELIDVGNDPRWFKLVAYNAAGQGPVSAAYYSVPSYPPPPLPGTPTEPVRPTTVAPTEPVTPTTVATTTVATVPVPPPGA